MIGLRSILRRIRACSALLRHSRIYSDDSARSVVHLFRLLESVHYSGIPFVGLEEIVEDLRPLQPAPLDRVVMHPRLLGGGSGSVAEMAALATITAARLPKTILEFGTYDGCSTWHLWANTCPDASITTLDLPAGARISGSTDAGLQGGAHRPFLPRSERVTLVEADSRDWEPRSHDPVDLCFIDAGHSYACVKNDTEKALSIMSPLGVVLWHDASWTADGYGVNEYLRDLRRQGLDVRLVRVGPCDYCALAILLPSRQREARRTAASLGSPGP